MAILHISGKNILFSVYKNNPAIYVYFTDGNDVDIVRKDGVLAIKNDYVSFDEEDGNTYFDTLLNMYKGSLHIYKVNMSLGINASNKGDTGNYNATKSSELVISGPTLIKIKDGRIVKYLEDLDKIKEELNN